MAELPVTHAMDCPSCGHPSSSGAGFCGECGTRLANLPACAGCGTPHRSGQKFCEVCGRRLVPSEHADPVTESTPVAFGGGRFQDKRALGAGGRKRVFLAQDAVLDREVALALIRTAGLDEDDRARVTREAQAMAQLGDPPHVVTVFDIGEEGGELYIVSQYMSGGDLRVLLNSAEGRRLPFDRAVSIADQVARRSSPTRTGIVHRDIKPGNIWFTADGTVKLVISA